MTMADILNNNILQFFLCCLILVAYVITIALGTPNQVLEGILIFATGHYFGINTTPNSQVTKIVSAGIEASKD